MRVNLDAHLSYDFMLGGSQSKLSGLVNVMRERLLAVDVFAHLDGRHRCWGMRVIWRRHVNRVEAVAHCFEHLSPIDEGRGARRSLGSPGQVRGVDVAQSDDVDVRVTKELTKIRRPHAANSDTSQAQATLQWRSPHRGRQPHCACCEGRRSAQELAASGEAE